jgi:hypothetical protein
MHDNRAGEILERRAELRVEEALLQAEVAIPVDAFEQWVEQSDEGRRRCGLRRELGALSDAA